MTNEDERIKDKMAEIIVKIGTMKAAGIPTNTIRYYILTETSNLNIGGLEKTVFIGTLEKTLEDMDNEQQTKSLWSNYSGKVTTNKKNWKLIFWLIVFFIILIIISGKH